MIFYVTETMVFLEIQKSNYGINNSKYHQELGETARCMKSKNGERKGLVQMNLIGATKDFSSF